MPTSESFFFPEEDRLLEDPYPFDVDFDGPPNDAGALLKDSGFMGGQSSDGSDGNVAAMFDYPAYVSNSPRMSGQPILAAEKPNPHLPSHRGSTSSSSSLRSADSNSPHTSVDAIPMDTSSNDWLEDFRGGGGAFGIDDAVDISSYLTLSAGSSSPDPPASTEPSPDSPAASETLAQGRATKRRKAQPKKPTVSFILFKLKAKPKPHTHFMLTVSRNSRRTDWRTRSGLRVSPNSPLSRHIFLAASHHQATCMVTILPPQIAVSTISATYSCVQTGRLQRTVQLAIYFAHCQDPI